MTVDFDPPLAKVPNEWEKYFDKSSWNDFTDKEREQAESFISKIFQVIFVKNSEETEQKSFGQDLASFSPAGLTINLQFSDPLLVSQGEVSNQRQYDNFTIVGS